LIRLARREIRQSALLVKCARAEHHQQYLAEDPNGYCGIGGSGVVCAGADSSAAVLAGGGASPAAGAGVAALPAVDGVAGVDGMGGASDGGGGGGLRAFSVRWLTAMVTR
jgi:hypothetical protein